MRVYKYYIYSEKILHKISEHQPTPVFYCNMKNENSKVRNINTLKGCKAKNIFSKYV